MAFGFHEPDPRAFEEPAPDPQLLAQEAREIEEEIRRDRRSACKVALFFVLAFVLCGLYTGWYALHNRVELFSNDYNNRDELLMERNRRGTIYAADRTELAKTEVHEDEENGVYQTRIYPFGKMYAHAIGYADLGGSGVESYCKYQLLHSDVSFSEKVACDKKENAADRLYPGNNVVTTLDPKLQQAAYEALGDLKGAVVITEPSTGKILAMVSKPDFDPGQIEDLWEGLLNDSESGTLVNRVTQGLYPPGSTFKIVDCIDLLEELPDAGKTYSFDCDGQFEQGEDRIHCFDYEVHGKQDLKESFAHSCNSSFANIGLNYITTKNMRQTLRRMLFNTDLPYDLPSARSHIDLRDDLPTDQVMQVYIGQGQTEVTPLHMNLITCTVANGGVLMKPYLVETVETASGEVLEHYDPRPVGTLIDSDVAGKVADLMKAVCSKEYTGTARMLDGRGYTVAGKTGSAEYREGIEDFHSWFTGFAPADDPKICITVVIEGQGNSSSYAVPVTAEILDSYFGN